MSHFSDSQRGLDSQKNAGITKIENGGANSKFLHHEVAIYQNKISTSEWKNVCNMLEMWYFYCCRLLRG